jgi:hypothetical protein
MSSLVRDTSLVIIDSIGSATYMVGRRFQTGTKGLKSESSEVQISSVVAPSSSSSLGRWAVPHTIPAGVI